MIGGYPLSDRYDQAWLRSLDMGPHPLRQAEALLPDLALRPGQRVLDLGCGRGATSVFLARECGVSVVAFDLWVDAATIGATLRAAGVADRVEAVQGDARRLPFPDEEFDAVLCVDALEYVGTDVTFLPSLLRVVKPDGRIAASTPGLADDPYLTEPPSPVRDLVGGDVAGWHPPAWWRRHWQLSGRLHAVQARWMPDGHAVWLDWSRGLGAADAAVTAMLEAVGPDALGLVLVSGVRS